MRTRGMIVLTVLLSLACAAQASCEQPIEPLAGFAPLLGTHWMGHFVSLPAPPFEHFITWDLALSGQVIRWLKTVDDVGFVMETYFYWDRIRETIAFVQLCNNGIHGTGVAEVADDTLTLLGVAMQPSGAIEFRQTFEQLEDGALVDRYDTRAGDAWSPEHVIVYTLVPEEGTEP